jgi:hypothetical protein
VPIIMRALCFIMLFDGDSTSVLIVDESEVVYFRMRALAC